MFYPSSELCPQVLFLALGICLEDVRSSCLIRTRAWVLSITLCPFHPEEQVLLDEYVCLLYGLVQLSSKNTLSLASLILSWRAQLYSTLLNCLAYFHLSNQCIPFELLSYLYFPIYVWYIFILHRSGIHINWNYGQIQIFSLVINWPSFK